MHGPCALGVAQPDRGVPRPDRRGGEAPQRQNVAGTERNPGDAEPGEFFLSSADAVRGGAGRRRALGRPLDVLDQGARTLHGISLRIAAGTRLFYIWTWSRRAASEMEPLSDGYTVKVLATSSTCSFCVTAIEIAKMSSEAFGPTTTPPMTVPEPLRAKILMK